jgi:hypothetical protein
MDQPISGALQIGGEQLARRRIVVNDEHCGAGAVVDLGLDARRLRRSDLCRRLAAGGQDDREGRTFTRAAVMSPPSSWQNRREIARPSPVPPYFLAVEVSAWLNAWNRRPSCSSVMPMPVSETANRTIWRSLSKRSATTVRRPFSVNLLPLLNTFSRLCLSLVRSVRMLPRPSAKRSSSVLPFFSASPVLPPSNALRR